MAAYKCNRSLRKKLSSDLVKIISSLRKENVYLKKTLAEVSRHHAEHNKLVERLLALETLRLESCQQLPTKDEKTSSSSEDLCTKEMNSVDGDSPSEKEVSSNDEAVLHLQNKLNDALEKNQQWLEYDQQREAYVRAILDKMLWLEKQLNEANQAHSQQHNEEHSDEEAQKNNRERFESFLKEVDLLHKQVEVVHRKLISAEERFREREKELEALTHQLKSDTASKGSPQEECSNPEEEEEQQLKEETEELQAQLKEEKRRSTSFELQASLYQRYMLNHHHADQEKIADLERQLRISSQDLEDAKRDSSYLKKQLLRILKRLPKTKGKNPKQSKRDQRDVGVCEEASPDPWIPRGSLASLSHSSALDESFLECPTCQAEYPASQYRELLTHLEMCLE
ncbi:centrosomal protein of 55 kDa-like [Fundulus heteroclitus]|uniref:centrosomal protein of 55 kDa-like n=1 Tax=Fundulus heteroclitus TaxID=8078 RepID=UPI00165C3DB9|nr:centrosomal protein of 55 kDa-like [Fundulus heteroclitus]